VRISKVLNADGLGTLFLCFLGVLCLGYVPHSASAASPPDAAAIILIRNATILTVSHGTIEHGSILIKDGKITEVSQSINAPKDAQVIDAAGQFVMPGIIDCHSHISRKASTRAAFPSPRW